MKSYQFRFNNRSKTSAILVWFFTVLLAITLTTTLFLVRPAHDLSSWLLLILFPFLLIAIYKLFKTASERQSTEIVTLNKDGFTSACFGSVLFSNISAINIPAREISLLGGENYDYYKKNDVDTPNIVISITTDRGDIFCWSLNEWGGFYNSKEDFSICFDFLTALTDQLVQCCQSDESPKSYLKILDENGIWKRSNGY